MVVSGFFALVLENVTLLVPESRKFEGQLKGCVFFMLKVKDESQFSEYVPLPPFAKQRSDTGLCFMSVHYLKQVRHNHSCTWESSCLLC